MVDQDPYAWWKLALPDPSKIGRTPDLQLHEDTPQPGYYRRRGRNGQWQAVAIWPSEDHGGIVATVNDHPVTQISALWVSCCGYPISEDAYHVAIEGGGWPDEPPPPAAMGDNLPDDPYDRLNAELFGERELAEEYLRTPIRTQDDADRAAILAKRIAEIGHRADREHAREKAPVADEVKRIDNRWRELRDLPASLSKRLKMHQKAFLDELDRRERERVAAAEREARRLREEAARKVREAEDERRRQVEEARRLNEEAERLAREGDRKAAEEAQRAADSASAEGDRAMADAGQAVADLKEAERQTEYVRPQAGRTRERVSLRSHRSAIIEDADKLFAAIKDDTDLKATMQSIADRGARAKIALPGCRIVEESRPV